MGAGLALVHLLRKMGKQAHMVTDGGPPAELMFLPGAGGIGRGPRDCRPPYDLLFTVDCGNLDRLERVLQGLPPDVQVINIDHHVTNTLYGNVNWIDPEASAVGEMVYRLVRAARIPLSREIAMPIYTAIVEDTGRFSFSNTHVSTHRVAADLLGHGVDPDLVHRHLYGSRTLPELKLHAAVIRSLRRSPDGRVAWIRMTDAMFRSAGYVPTDTQEFVQVAKNLKGVAVAILFRPLSRDGEVKVSLRTDGSFDAAKFCTRHGGGGHVRAAGVTLRGSLASVERRVVGEVRARMKRDHAS